MFFTNSVLASLSVCLIISELQRDVGLGSRAKIVERKAIKISSINFAIFVRTSVRDHQGRSDRIVMN